MTSERESQYAKRIIELLDERDLAKKELEKLRERVGNAEDLKHRLEVAEAVNRSRGEMEQVMIEALEPFASRARGSNYVPQDANVTVFMKDCRAALDAINPMVRGVKAESLSFAEKVSAAIREIEDKHGPVEHYELNTTLMAPDHWNASVKIGGVEGMLTASGYGPDTTLLMAASVAGYRCMQERKYGAC